jgi:uncharacterized membrane protein (UPF0136 family)
MQPTTVLWIYIVLLVAGGLMGFLKGKSKASLIMSLIFAALLSLCATRGLLDAHMANVLANVILAFLLVFFGWRLTKSKKFMPNGLMVVLTLAALVLRNFR